MEFLQVVGTFSVDDDNDDDDFSLVILKLLVGQMSRM